MSTLTLTRTSSTYIREDLPTKQAGSNPTFLYVKAEVGGNNQRRDTLLNYPLPGFLLDPSTKIVSATLDLSPYGAWPAASNIGVGLITKGWAASTVKWSSFVGMDNVINVALANPFAANPFLVDVKPHMELIRGGKKFYGWRISTTSTTNRIFRNRLDAMPTLVIEYTRAPARPSVAAPTDGQTVSDAAPVVKMTQTDPTLTTVNAIQVQVNTNESEIGTWDSGEWLTTETLLDLSTTDFPPVAVVGQSRWWRGRVRGDGDEWSEWTAWTEFVYDPLGTISIITPADPPDDFVTEQTPPIAWATFGFDQEFYRAMLFDHVTNVKLWDSDWVRSQDTSTHPPKGKIVAVDHQYRAEVWAHDGKNRSLSDADPYARDVRVFTYKLAAAIDPVINLTVEDMTPLPFVKLRWERTPAADQYEIVRDGIVVDLVDAAEVLEDDGTFAYIDPTAPPRRAHIWTVRAVVNGLTSAVNPSEPGEIEPAGIWLCDLENGDYVTLITETQQTMSLSEDGGTFIPLNARYAIRITTSLHGYGGTVVGEILKTDLTGDETGQSMRDRFLQMRERKSQVMSLVLADNAMRVVPFNMTISESPRPGKNGDYVYPCSFEFVQVA